MWEACQASTDYWEELGATRATDFYSFPEIQYSWLAGLGKGGNEGVLMFVGVLRDFRILMKTLRHTLCLYNFWTNNSFPFHQSLALRAIIPWQQARWTPGEGGIHSIIVSLPPLWICSVTILLSVQGYKASLSLLFSCLFWVVSPQVSCNSRLVLGEVKCGFHSLIRHFWYTPFSTQLILSVFTWIHSICKYVVIYYVFICLLSFFPWT